ncbi:hypothetical protein FDP22_17390 [Paroceanicella profunda]|uniref:DUF4440 domain-containing protein n=1 Tax=Paroceanicella profunda TaxID=2579971 RepID=A0A5B8FI69_9RHOB|nr:hypothetical protein [Paroceanicella profunda]QDL93401.1 hypothetical protein FDP22_17390 [Paroceanicella profunda]
MTEYQKWLDTISASYKDGDYDTYVECFELPFTVITNTANILVTEKDELRAGFDALCHMLRGEGITDSIRIASNVRNLGPNLMIGRYDTHLLRGANRVFDPLLSATTLRRSPDGQWRACSFTLDLGNAQWPFYTLMLPQTSATIVAA